MEHKFIKFNSRRKLSVFIISAILIFSLSPAFAENIMEEEAGEYFKEALEAQKSGNLDSAITLYTKSLYLKPDNAKAYNNLGTIYAKNGDYDKAEEEYNQAIKMDPHYAKALTNLAMIYLEKKDFDKFYEYWKRATGLDIHTPFLMDEDKD